MSDSLSRSCRCESAGWPGRRRSRTVPVIVDQIARSPASRRRRCRPLALGRASDRRHQGAGSPATRPRRKPRSTRATNSSDGSGYVCRSAKSTANNSTPADCQGNSLGLAWGTRSGSKASRSRNALPEFTWWSVGHLGVKAIRVEPGWIQVSAARVGWRLPGRWSVHGRCPKCGHARALALRTRAARGRGHRHQTGETEARRGAPGGSRRWDGAVNKRVNRWGRGGPIGRHQTEVPARGRAAIVGSSGGLRPPLGLEVLATGPRCSGRSGGPSGG